MIREYDDKWHWIKGELQLPAATLEGNGKWAKYSSYLNNPFSANGKFPIAVVEIVGASPEVIANEAQQLRDQAPDIENSSIKFKFGPIYSTLQRDLVLVMAMVLSPSDFIDVVDRPLPSVRFVVLEWIKRCLKGTDQTDPSS